MNFLTMALWQSKFLIHKRWKQALRGAYACHSVFEVLGQVENAETEMEVRKQKYGNGNTEVRRKAAYQCLVHECAL